MLALAFGKRVPGPHCTTPYYGIKEEFGSPPPVVASFGRTVEGRSSGRARRPHPPLGDDQPVVAVKSRRMSAAATLCPAESCSRHSATSLSAVMRCWFWFEFRAGREERTGRHLETGWSGKLDVKISQKVSGGSAVVVAGGRRALGGRSWPPASTTEPQPLRSRAPCRVKRPITRVGTWPPSMVPCTPEEREALLAALRRACTCLRATDGHIVLCGAHAMLLDERAVKHLIFYRRCRGLLWPGELRTS
jgi:hypothetical protein